MYRKQHAGCKVRVTPAVEALSWGAQTGKALAQVSYRETMNGAAREAFGGLPNVREKTT